MRQPCMQAYSLLLIKTCHRRGVHAMGGMAAQIPIKNDPAANSAAMEKVKHPACTTCNLRCAAVKCPFCSTLPVAPATFLGQSRAWISDYMMLCVCVRSWRWAR